MTLPPSKKYILLLSSFFIGIAIATVLLSCFSEPSGNLVLSTFAPETMGSTRFEPFFFTLDSTYYGNADKASIYNERAANVRDWANHLKNEVSTGSIGALVYNSILGNYPYLKEARNDTNSCLKWMLAHNDEEDFQYLKFAKLCEPFVNPKMDPNFYWGYGTKLPLRNVVEKEGLIKIAISAMADAKSDFTRLRYGYQLVRLACYNEKYKDCIDYYDKYVEPIKSNSIMKYWALAIKARALYKSGAPQYSKYCYAIVFDRCHSRRMLAKQGFFWAVEYGDVQAGKFRFPDKKYVTEYCKNNLEKIPVYALTAMISVYDNSDLLDSIYQIDPKSEMLEWLLVRGINQFEYDVLPERNRDYQSENYFAKDTMLGAADRWGDGGIAYAYQAGYDFMVNGNESKDMNRFYPHVADRSENLGLKNQLAFINFVSRCAQNNNTRKPALWNLCAAYLHCLNGTYASAHAYLEKVNEPTDTIITNQKKITALLLKIRELNPHDINDAKENEIANDFKSLNQCAPHMRCKDLRSALLLQLSAKYAKSNNPLKAVLCEAASSWSMDMNEKPRLRPLDDLITFAEKKNKTPFEQILSNSTATNLNDLYEIKGTVLLTQYKYKEAMVAFAKSNKRNESLSNPFMIHSKDCHDCDYTTADSVRNTSNNRITYTKLEFVTRMNELETKSTTTKGEEQAQTFFLLGNATYNLSSFGNCWYLTEYPFDPRDAWIMDTKFNNPPRLAHEGYYYPFFDCGPAKNYYMKALATTHDREFAAKCCFMIAKCDQNSYYISDDYTYSEKGINPAKLKYRDYFKKLKSDYPDTKFYAEALKECEYFRTYISRN